MEEVEDYLQTGIAYINARLSGYSLLGKDIEDLKKALNIYFASLEKDDEIDYSEEYKIRTDIQDYFKELGRNESLESLLYYMEKENRILDPTKNSDRLEILKLIGLKKDFNENLIPPLRN